MTRSSTIARALRWRTRPGTSTSAATCCSTARKFTSRGHDSSTRDRTLKRRFGSSIHWAWRAESRAPIGSWAWCTARRAARRSLRRASSALQLSSGVGAALDEAEASRELALLYQGLGRSQEALRLLNLSHRLFRRLDARVDLVDVKAKVGHLESVYLEIVREWGRSIESSDTYTHGHSERVATYAASLAAAMGLDETELQTIRVGAYLHDLGKVRIPHEILNKPGRLTNEEFDEIAAPGIRDRAAGVGRVPVDIRPSFARTTKAGWLGYPIGCV